MDTASDVPDTLPDGGPADVPDPYADAVWVVRMRERWPDPPVLPSLTQLEAFLNSGRYRARRLRGLAWPGRTPAGTDGDSTDTDGDGPGLVVAVPDPIQQIKYPQPAPPADDPQPAILSEGSDSTPDTPAAGLGVDTAAGPQVDPAGRPQGGPAGSPQTPVAGSALVREGPAQVGHSGHARPFTAPDPRDRVISRRFGYVGLLLGGGGSLAANVGHTYLPPPGRGAGWVGPEAGAVAGAMFWPLALFTVLEIFTRTPWPDRWHWQTIRYTGTASVALVAAAVSYRHISGMLAHWGDDPLVVYGGPVAVDGLLMLATAALICTPRTRTPVRRAPLWKRRH